MEAIRMKNKDIRLSGLMYESLVNGPGMRRVFFSQGCKHNCKDCFNKDTHDFQGGELFNMDELIEDVKVNPMLKGITFSGGDPLEQAEEFAYMAENFKEKNLNIWCYTGYTYEYILKNIEQNQGWKKLLMNVDVLVDGKFEKDKALEGLKYRGSTNQRIIDVKKSLDSGKIVTLEY